VPGDGEAKTRSAAGDDGTRIRDFHGSVLERWFETAHSITNLRADL
jgi:hypothetical protein